MKCRMLFCAVLFGVFAFGGANPGTSQKKDEPPKKAAEGDELAKLGKARLEAAEKAYKALVEGSTTTSEARYQYSIRWLNAELDVANKKDERVRAYAGHLQRMKDWQKRNPEDAVGPIISTTIQSFLTEAEYWLAKLRSAKN